MIMKETKQTLFSADRKYRYSLWRWWGNEPPHYRADDYAMFVGLNPSTADEINDDPTVRRCIGFAKRWGHSGLQMMNLFGYRTTYPYELVRQQDPVGPGNDDAIALMAKNAGIIVAAWGRHGRHLERDSDVLKLLKQHNVYCFGRNKDGSPRHPLYLKYDTGVAIYNGRKDFPPTLRNRQYGSEAQQW